MNGINRAIVQFLKCPFQMSGVFNVFWFSVKKKKKKDMAVMNPEDNSIL